MPHWQALDPLAAPPAHARRASSGCCCARARCSRCSWSSRICTGSIARPRPCSTAWSRACPRRALLLLVNYRPEYQHGWGSKTYYSQLRLDPLPPESADELLEALLGQTTAGSQPLKQLLVERTEGNPFFLEESVRTLVETGALAGERGAYRLTRPVETPAGAGHGAGDPGRAHRPAARPTRQAAAADRPRSSARTCPSRCSRPSPSCRRTNCARAGPPAGRRVPLRDAALSRSRVHLQARADPRGGLRRACSRSGGARCTPASSRRSSDSIPTVRRAGRAAGPPRVPRRAVGEGGAPTAGRPAPRPRIARRTVRR